MVRVVLWQEFPSIHMSFSLPMLTVTSVTDLDVLMYTFQTEPLCMVYLVILLASDLYIDKGKPNYWESTTLSTISVLMSYHSLVQ